MRHTLLWFRVRTKRNCPVAPIATPSVELFHPTTAIKSALLSTTCHAPALRSRTISQANAHRTRNIHCLRLLPTITSQKHGQQCDSGTSARRACSRYIPTSYHQRRRAQHPNRISCLRARTPTLRDVDSRSGQVQDWWGS